ncbi:MAG: hypothetical protein J6K69_07195 [Candidatus Methanomethylophilaceae archaeon]|nr:hypothetical protein [Candidatus Methanomethylophilaceae archaeon]
MNIEKCMVCNHLIFRKPAKLTIKVKGELRKEGKIHERCISRLPSTDLTKYLEVCE